MIHSEGFQVRACSSLIKHGKPRSAKDRRSRESYAPLWLLLLLLLGVCCDCMAWVTQNPAQIVGKDQGLVMDMRLTSL